MTKDYKPVHGIWASRWVFILAATGSAVGLGNLWKFPYMAGDNGGGAFVLIYLVCIALVGVPIMIAEVMLGRRGGLSPIHTMGKLARDAGVSQRWSAVGGLGALAGFFLLSLYTVIAGWALYYIWEMASGALQGADAKAVADTYSGLRGNFWLMLGCHTAFMAMTMLVVARGVNKGLEAAVRILMPLLFVLLLVLLVYSATTDGFMPAVNFLFRFDASAFSVNAVLLALGHAFFTLSLGLGAIMAYGAYMPREVTDKRTGKRKSVSIGSTVFTIAGLDTLIALVAGLVIFPIVFANGLAPDEGPGLMFVTLPLAFANIPFGMLLGTVFFVLLVCAAWTSSISLGEPLVAWMVENGWKRWTASLTIGASAWFLGLGTVLSFNHWQEVTLFGRTFFGNLEFLTINIMLPLGGLLIAIFAGWIMKETHARKELAMKSFGLYMVWRAMIRIFAPLAVIVIFIFVALVQDDDGDEAEGDAVVESAEVVQIIDPVRETLEQQEGAADE